MDINNAIQVAGKTALSMYSAMPVKIALLVVALLFCFAGFKLLRGVTALLGVVFGVACGTCIPGLLNASMTPFIEMVLTILAMVVLGIVCGIICFKFYQLGVFLVFAVVGVGVVYVPALFVAERSMTAFWVILAVGALLFGATSVLFLRPISIVVTSCFGLAAAFPIMELLKDQIGVQPMWMTVALGAVLSVLGLVVQLLTNRKADAHPLGEEDDEEDDEEDEDEPAVPVAAQPDEIDGVSDSTQVLDMSELPQEEPDEIDSISDLIAARIGLAEPETQPLTQAAVQEMTRRMEEPETKPLVEQAEEPETKPLVEQAEEPETKPLAEQAEELETLELAEQPEQEMTEPETEEQAAPEQPEESVPEAAADTEESAETSDEAEETIEETPEPVDPVTRLLDAMRPQAKISTVPVEEKIEPLQSGDEPTADLEETQTEPDDEPTVVFTRAEQSEPEETAEPDIELTQVLKTTGDELTQILETAEPVAETPVVPAENELTQVLEMEEPAEEAPVEPEESPQEPDTEPTEVLEKAEPTELGNEPTQLLEELPVSEPEEETPVQDEPAEPSPALLDLPEELPPEPQKHSNPLHVVAAVLLAAGALLVATLGFRYVEVVLTLGFVCYLCKWYRTAAFACAILCVRRAVDAVLLYTQTSGFVLGLNHTTLELAMDGVSCLALLLLTFVAVHSYTKSRHADEDEE